MEPHHLTANNKYIESQINIVLSDQLDRMQDACYFDLLDKEQQQMTKYRNRNERNVGDKLSRQNYRCEMISPHGNTKNYVRFYESNFPPDQATAKFNFQLIKNKFESCENSSKSPDKKSKVSRNSPFNFTKLCRKFSSNTKNKLCICHHVERQSTGFQSSTQTRHTSKESHKGSEHKNNAKETFNSLLKEIIEAVESKKSGKMCLNPKSKPRATKEFKESKSKY